MIYNWYIHWKADYLFSLILHNEFSQHIELQSEQSEQQSELQLWVQISAHCLITELLSTK